MSRPEFMGKPELKCSSAGFSYKLEMNARRCYLISNKFVLRLSLNFILV